MLDFMHDGEPRGHLTAGGKAISEPELAKKLGLAPGRVRTLVAELEERNVFSRTEAAVIFSRRMVRDEQLSEIRRTAGKLGGNPALTPKQPDKVEDKGLVNQSGAQTGKQKPTPAVAVAVGSLPSATAKHPSSSPESSLERVLSLAPDREAWIAAISKSGATDAQQQRAADAFLGNGAAKTPRLNLFLGYLRHEKAKRGVASTGTKARPSRAGGGASSKYAERFR
jgi:hypothetical protein